jgi:hypothetical protein
MSLQERLDREFNAKQLEIARSKGILEPSEEVEAVVSIWKYSMLISFLGLLARLLQKCYLLVVTKSRVLLIHVPAFAVHGGGYFEHAAIDRPCRLQLQDPPKQVHQIGNKILLLQPFASFVARPSAFVLLGIAAKSAFDIASSPSGSA